MAPSDMPGKRSQAGRRGYSRAVLGRLARNPRVRGLARGVPGLSRAYWGLRERLILRRGVATLDYPGASIRLHVQSAAVVRLRLRAFEKEPWTVEWLERQLRPGDAFYDVGANVGVYSLIAASICPDARIVAIEPAPANYEALCRNLVLNGAADAVIPVPVALAETTHLAALEIADPAAGAAEHVLDGPGASAGRTAVLAYSLDDLVESLRLPQPTLLKIDVDGGEDAVLAGAAATLRDPRLRSLMLEVDHVTTEPVLAVLGRSGFTIVRRIDERAGQPLPGVWYGVFERSD